MSQSDTINELAKALAEAQTELQNPTKKKTAKVGTYSYSYADIAEVLDTVRPVLARHGIAITQPTVLDGDVLLIHTVLTHASGQQMASSYPVCRLSGEHQKMGAALTYARRYALCSMIGVAAEDDTDAQGAAEIDAPRNGTKTRGPDWGKSAQAKRRGDWGELENDLRDCHSVVAVDRLQADYRGTQYPNWSAAWREQAEELFEKRRMDFGGPAEPEKPLTLREQLQGSVEAERPPVATATRADYLRYCSDTIEGLSSTDEINSWWEEQAAARKRFRLSPAEESDIKARAKERLKTLRKPAPTATFVPNARERAEAEKT
jgi:hypothetical protein